MLPSTKELAEVFQEWCAKAEDIRVVTAWATADCPEYSRLASARNAITTMIVGLDFYTTSPSFLKSFRSITRIGNAPGTFHPKVYLFKEDNGYCCIIGSSNFTTGGFGDNAELNICVEGDVGDSFFGDVSQFIDEQEQHHSHELSTPELDDYEAQFERFKASRARLAKFRTSEAAKLKAKAKRVRQAKGQEPPEQLNKTWPELVKVILAQEKRPGLIIQGTEKEPGYLETAVPIRSLMRVLGKPFQCRGDDHEEDGMRRYQRRLNMQCADHFSLLDADSVISANNISAGS